MLDGDRRLAMLLVAAVVALTLGSAAAQTEAKQGTAAPDAASFVKPIGSLYGPVPLRTVIDGDTVVVFSNVGPRIVRLIGVDAPELYSRDPLGEAAAAYLRRLLPRGAQVWLELDFGTEDIYGRLLAYLYVADPDGEWVIAEHRVTQVNLAMARAGWAKALEIEPNSTYSDLYRAAQDGAEAAQLGMWGEEVPARNEDALPDGPIVIHCALYNPDTPNDKAGEWVSLLLREPLDTRGYNLYDEGSKAVFRLPAGVQPAGELKISNPGQGVWNNGGDVIYLRFGTDVVDAWDYSDKLVPEGEITCRGAD